MPADAVNPILPLLVATVVALAFLAAALVSARRLLRQAREDSAGLVEEARRDADSRAKEILVAAHEKVLAQQEEADKRDQDLEAREITLETQLRELDTERAAVQRDRKELERRRQELESAERERKHLLGTAREEREEARRTLERIAGLSAEQAKGELVAGIQEQARREAGRLARKILDEAREGAERDALNLMVQATQRINVKRAVETTVSFIELPSDEMKGRIIGREGRNIRALEIATGIDLIVDDTPRSILISSFDPVRREVARLAIERLIEDGRIHPARIEEVVDKVRGEIDAHIEERGAQAAFELGVSDLHPRLNRLVGRLDYQTLHGHNLLRHSVEVGLIAGFMASEVGGRVDIARRSGLLHEVGRGEHSVVGHPVLVSAEIAGRLGESDDVVHCIQSLHRDVEARLLEALLVNTANRLSESRPGASKENLQVFIERLRRLEEIAGSHPGVRQAYAVKAGRELRVFADTHAVTDQEAQTLARKIARAVEKEVAFQGKIKVSVIRETRAVHFAV